MLLATCLIKDISTMQNNFKLAKVCEISLNDSTGCCIITHGNWVFENNPIDGNRIGSNKIETYLNRNEYFYNRIVQSLLNQGYTKI